MKTGGIPYVAVMNRTDEKIAQYMEGIYNTVIVKDIEQQIRYSPQQNNDFVEGRGFIDLFRQKKTQATA